MFVRNVFAFENDNSSASRVQKSVARLVRLSFKIEVRLEVDVGDAFRKNKFQKVVLDDELVVELGSCWNLKIMFFFKNFSKKFISGLVNLFTKNRLADRFFIPEL